MNVIPAEGDERIFKGLSAFVKECLGKVFTVRGYVGRVSKPKGPDYVLITVMAQAATSTHSAEYDAQGGTVTVIEPTRKTVQIDCYGKESEVWAKTLALLLGDEVGVTFLQEYGFAPLYVGNVLNLTSDNNKGGFTERWTLNCMVHRPEKVTKDQEFFEGVVLESRYVSVSPGTAGE
jgi:hypothetical protein